ncbi:hypothetical protein N431DRAFT_445578 [Stipitochalara longipes BDJ]|nr:hypothetical protein N431DRAFT_445578 [Stipitochalara longipes BDJ]
MVNFFNTNPDPVPLIYYAVGYVPPALESEAPSAFSSRTILTALSFNDPTNPLQPPIILRLNEHFPAPNSDTAWLRDISDYRTLLLPAWPLAEEAILASSMTDALSQIAYSQQELGEVCCQLSESHFSRKSRIPCVGQ